MSDSNRVEIRTLKESSFGVMDTGNPMVVLQNLQSEGLEQTTDASAPEVIRSDYVKPQVTRRSVGGGGPINLFLSGVDPDEFIEGAMRDVIGSANSTNGSLTATAASANFSLTGAFTNMIVGDFFSISGSSDNDGVWQIETKNTNDDVDVVEYADQSVTDEGPTGSVDIANGGALDHGTTLMSWTVERQFEDLTTYIDRFLGQRIAGVTGTWGVGQDSTLVVDFLGKAPTLETAIGGDGTTTDGPGNPIHNGIDNVQGIAKDGADLTACVASITLNLGSPVRPRECLGSLGPSAIGGNAFEFTGSIELYNDDTVKAWMAHRYDFTSLSLSWASVDANGVGYGFYLPQLKLTSGNPQAGGSDQDISATFDFVCEADANNRLIRITKLT